MKRKILLTTFFTFLATCILGKNYYNVGVVNASSFTAAVQGFSISGMDYQEDKRIDNEEIKTSENSYGFLSLWSAIYSIYDSETDTILYAIPVVTEIQSNTYSDLIKRFVNRKIVLTVSFNYNEAACFEVAYPNNSDYDGQYSVSLSTVFSLEASSNSVGIGGSIEFSTTNYVKEILLTQTKSSDNKSITSTYDFSRYSKNSVTDKAPYRGLYVQRSLVFFSIENYSQINMSDSEISVKYTGYIFKDHWSKNVTKSKTLQSTYVFNTSTGEFI